jgi:histidinol-phosphatase (PHP family)
MLEKYIDHHVHSCYSPDSNEPVESLIKHVLSLGLSTLMLTDHVDYDAPDKAFNTTPDYNAYKHKLEDLMKKYPIKILMGVELGYQPQAFNKNNELLTNHPFDFVILSIHYIDNLDLGNGDFFKNRTQYESYRRYYEVVLDAVKTFDNFDVLGHIDYIIRYGDKNAYHYEDYNDIIDEILKELIQKGKGLDLNTSGYRYGLNTFHPCKDILIRFKELGGSIITLGSDSHKKEYLQTHFLDALNLLKSVGFTHVTHFAKRKPEFIEI